jgi:hypothetical protein
MGHLQVSQLLPRQGIVFFVPPKTILIKFAILDVLNGQHGWTDMSICPLSAKHITDI